MFILLRKRRKYIHFAYLSIVTVLCAVSLLQAIINHPPFFKNTFQWHLKSYDEYGCGCPRYGPVVHNNYTNDEKTSVLCSEWATSRGPHQKIIAYSVYGDPKNMEILKNYYNGIENRLREASYFYNDWIVRLYHNASKEDKYTNRLICKLYCEYSNFDPCQVKNLFSPKSWKQEKMINIKSKFKKNIFFQKNMQLRMIHFMDLLTDTTELDDVENESIKAKYNDMDLFTTSFEYLLIGKMWRFLPMGDELVDYFLVRDVDSFILPREVAAVYQWIFNSSALIHSMRDHPSHNGPILAGLWGGSRLRNGEKLTQLLREMLSWPPRNLWDYDQILLRRIVWPQVIDDVMVHDSYHCQNPFLKAKEEPFPFPTKRKGRLFVSWGPTRSLSEINNIMPCPFKCRPIEHPEWTLC